MQQHATRRLNAEMRIDFRVRKRVLDELAHLLQELLDAAQVAAVVSERLSTVVDDIDFGVRSPMFEFTIITSDAEALSFAKLQKAAAYVFDG